MTVNTNALKTFAAIISSLMTILAGIWFIGRPMFDNRVHDLIEEHNATRTFKAHQQDIFIDFVKSAAFEKELDIYLTQNNSANSSVSLRKLLSVRMNIPQEQVAEKLAELYNKDRKRLYNLLRSFNTMYPELNIWEIN